MKKIFIDGSHGTTGLKIAKRLANRDDIELLKVDFEDRRNVEVQREMINKADLVFLCLPDNAVENSLNLIENDELIVIDTSSLNRTNIDFAYGFMELSDEHSSNIQTYSKISNPGCHASGFIANIFPLTAGGMLDKKTPLTCFSMTGYSGGGKQMIASYKNEISEEMKSTSHYALTQNHKHLKEMREITGLEITPIFSPVIVNFDCGMAVSTPLFISQLSNINSRSELYDYYYEYYKNSKLITPILTKEDQPYIYSNELRYKDNMKIYITGNDERVVVTSVFDNLGKGACGSAIQCMNLALGFDELKGLVY